MLNLAGLLIQLLFHLKEDSLTFLALSLFLCDLCEGDPQLLTELWEVLGYLELLVKRDYAVFVVDYNRDESFSVAFVEELLYFVPGAEKAELFNQRFEIQVGVEMLGLLKDTNSKSALDQGFVDG